MNMIFPRLTTSLGTFSRNSTLCFRSLSTASAAPVSGLPLHYSRAMGVMHWLVAPSLLGCIGAVMRAQQLKGKEKGKVMFYHKSLGLLTGLLVVPRIAVMIMSKKPAPFSTNYLERLAGTLSHWALYGFLAVMPATGILMGYYSGFGLPFFYKTLPGAAEARKDISGPAFKIHKTVGHYGKYLVPLHVAASGFHFVRGEAIFARINPLR